MKLRIAGMALLLSLAIGLMVSLQAQRKVGVQCVAVKLLQPPQPLKTGWAYAEFASETQVLRFLNRKEGAFPAEFCLAAQKTTTGQMIFHIFYQAGSPPADVQPWQVRKVNSTNEALDFANSQGTFAKLPEKEFRICGTATEQQPPSFWIFYRKLTGRTPEAAKGEWMWKWESFVSAKEVQNFLTRRRSYELLTDVEITGAGDKFHVFYRAPRIYDAPGMPTPVWNWIKRENAASVLEVLNAGTGGEKRMIQTARIAVINKSSASAFYLFY